LWAAGQDIVIDAAAPYMVGLTAALSGPREADTTRAIARTHALIAAARRHHTMIGYVSSFTTQLLRPQRVEWWPTRFASFLHPYFLLKQRIEEELLRASDLQPVIVNPTMCLGPWDTRDPSLSLIPRLLSGDVPGSVTHILNVIDVREVAAGLISAIEADYHSVPTILSGHNISAESLFRWIAEIGGSSPPRPSTPAAFAAFSSYLIEAIATFAGMRPSINSLAPLLIYQHQWMPPCAALRDLDVKVRPLYETLLDSVAWYREIGYC
jgi:dihydroflavonol-4-reductase